jgi:uncharacterized protein (TIGR02145 family)
MRTKIFLISVLATLCLGATSCDKDDNPKGGGGKTENPGGEGVTINGITWATCNVGAKGTFTTNPEDYGNYYTFEEAQTACPEGWRTPTDDEFESLCDRNKVTMEATGGTGEEDEDGYEFFDGWKFTDKTTNNSIFLPAVGFSQTDGTVYCRGTFGYYWSSNATGSTSGDSLLFHSTYVDPSYSSYYAYGHSVRCVRE